MSNVEQIGSRPERTGGFPRTRRARGRDSRVRKAPRVLVVEDEIFVAWHLETVLRDLDFAVCGLVPRGDTAVEEAERLDADVIVMDINLKGPIDGIEAARRIRATSEAAIIFVTAYSDKTTSERIQKAVPGAPVLSKPVSAHRLRLAIEQALAAQAN